ncbi:acetyl/propionyl/methylcrotonyl-CoA carboxylase subunit alpha [Nocardioides cheoyonin]|uniref:acetyl/propionyl/methylcrotonyl-CoA carboxylase subunit alpha n=1 Tax=Nocardioides cheoyonin TaxID=3156615 RepID=UPI0032B3C93C
MPMDVSTSPTTGEIHTLLVANRGEIARRVFRTARALGLRTVAVHTDLDAAAPHVRDADVAVRVPSYLDVDAVVAAAVESGAQAVHPGYGFLSERAEFARAVEKAGLVFVGPPADVIEQMGRKDAAREIAVQAGVPVVPQGDTATPPLLVKAAAGGGGKGMRVVRDPAGLEEAKAAAAREALNAFGDDTLLIERYVERGRHIEVQVLADAHGSVIHLGERDCSTQRRHQKVIEEAPAPTLTTEQRELVTGSAVALARQVGYVNAGTVEFLLDETTGEAYFLEMNTRLQVEHPVTEAVTGLDLVALQLAVAGGRPLPIAQSDVRTDGHAIEVRVYAEDSFHGFLPQAGTATRVRWPTGARVDHALESGQVVSTAYDPMLAKIIVHGPDREAARRALVRALDETAVLGLTTNTGFLRVLAASEEFRDAAIDTAWLDRHDLPAPDPTLARQIAAHAVAERSRYADAGPFRADGFRLGGPPAPVVVPLDEPVTVGPLPPGVAERATVAIQGPRVEVVHEGQRFVFEPPDRVAGPHAHEGGGSVDAPMPGTVLEVRVAEGDDVAEGDVLGVMEAMKMEVSLKAPFAGRVTSVAAVVGAQVALGAELFAVEPAEAAEAAEAEEAAND